MSILGDRSAPELGVYPRRDQPVIVRPEPDYRHHRKDDPDLKHYRGTLTLSNYESNQRTVIFKMKTNVPLKKITLSPNYGRLKPAQRKEVQIIISLNLNEDVSDFDWSVQVKVMDDPWSIGVGGCPDHNDFKSLWSDIPRVSKARTYQRKILFGDADTIIGGAFKPPKKNPSREEGDPFLKMKGSSKTKDDVAAKHNDSYPYPENTPPKNTRAVAHRYPGEETDNEYKAPLFSKAQNCLHESQPMRSRIPNLVPRSQDYPSEGLQMLKNNSKVLTKFPTPTPPIRSYIQNYEFDSHNGEEPVKEFDAPALMSSRSVKNEPSEHSDQNNDLLAEAADEILKVEAQNKKLLEQVSRLRMDISRAEVNKDSLRRRLFFTSVALISFIIILAVLLFC